MYMALEILVDTANLETIRKYDRIINLAGVTTNPTILAKERGDFWGTLKEIRKIIGDRQLHVQLTATAYEDMLKEADTITDRLGKGTYLKVPVNLTGLEVIKALKNKGYKVTGTAVYMPQQAMLAGACGADYVAPYFNRISNNNVDAGESIAEMKQIFREHDVPTRILAASFHNTQQIMDALLAGAEAVTASPEYYGMMVTNPLIDSAIAGFKKDWIGLYGDRMIYEMT